MPIYEYRCSQCGEFEVMQRITEPALKRCPTCEGKVKKLISNTSFQLKGSGWYSTDYGRRDGAGGNGNGNGNGKATDTKAESSSASGEKKEGKPGKSSEPAAA